MRTKAKDTGRNTPLKVLAAIAPVALVAALALSSTGSALQGRDTCNGKDADRILQGGADTEYRGTNKRDVVVGSPDDDKIRTRGGRDLVCAGFGDDRISGGTHPDRLHGEEGDDTIRGQRQEDFLHGGFEGKSFDDDYCLGGRPFPDTKKSFDQAVECEQVTSAFQLATR